MYDTLVLSSQNRKLGEASATYLPLTTCPDTCSHKGKGCYAEHGHVGMHARKKESMRSGGIPIAPNEWGNLEYEDIVLACKRKEDIRPLRLHVSGDVTNIGNVWLLSNITWRPKVWTYTHRHRIVHREAWGKVSVLASCDTLEDIEHALDTGYAPASVVSRFESNAPFRPARSSVWLIPCPNQTKGITCVQCGLCLEDRKLRQKGYGIAFASHGVSKRKLKVIQ